MASEYRHPTAVDIEKAILGHVLRQVGREGIEMIYVASQEEQRISEMHPDFVKDRVRRLLEEYIGKLSALKQTIQ